MGSPHHFGDRELELMTNDRTLKDRVMLRIGTCLSCCQSHIGSAWSRSRIWLSTRLFTGPGVQSPCELQRALVFRKTRNLAQEQKGLQALAHRATSFSFFLLKSNFILKRLNLL